MATNCLSGYSLHPCVNSLVKLVEEGVLKCPKVGSFLCRRRSRNMATWERLGLIVVGGRIVVCFIVEEVLVPNIPNL